MTFRLFELRQSRPKIKLTKVMKSYSSPPARERERCKLRVVLKLSTDRLTVAKNLDKKIKDKRFKASVGK